MTSLTYPGHIVSGGDTPSAAPPLRVVVTGVSSDSHTWNLIYLQLLLEEHGHDVVNLGPCVTPDLLNRRCHQERPDLVVMSSVNGHGHLDGPAGVRALRESRSLRDVSVVIGGQLGIEGPGGAGHQAELLRAGFDGVYEGEGCMTAFLDFVAVLHAATTQAARARTVRS